MAPPTPAKHAWIEHTGELELELEADSPEELFAEAAAALGGLLAEHEPDDGPDPGAGRSELAVAVSARDRATLLAEWLSELAFRAESEGLVPDRVARIDLAETGLDAAVLARPGRPPHLVKAVTYHRLAVWGEDRRWRGTVVLDV